MDIANVCGSLQGIVWKDEHIGSWMVCPDTKSKIELHRWDVVTYHAIDLEHGGNVGLFRGPLRNRRGDR
jgi:hypothetical protein